MNSTPELTPDPARETAEPTKAKKLADLIQTLSTEIATHIMEHRDEIKLIIIDVHMPAVDGGVPTRTIKHVGPL